MIGAGQLLFGPLSDRLGRRPVLLGGGLAYVVASMGLALTSSAEVFLGLRILQACGASACLVHVATVRDIYAGREESNVIWRTPIHAGRGTDNDPLLERSSTCGLGGGLSLRF